VFQHSKEPEIAGIQVWRIKWVETAFKFRIGDLWDDFPAIGIVRVTEQ
jgi:hypothetical protein